jgi:Uma2 family endonuclease
MESFSPPTEEETFNVDHRVCLHGVSWDQYQQLLEMRGDHSAPRFTYVEGDLEIMSPSGAHEHIKGKWSRLIEAWADETGVELESYGSWTLKRRKEERGVEPDECYVLGRANAKVPDLALEVNWTPGGFEKLEIYRRLGVREVQTWERGRISVHVLRRGHYVRVRRSEVLPGLDLRLVAQHLEVSTQTEAVRLFRAALRSKRPTH